MAQLRKRGIFSDDASKDILVISKHGYDPDDISKDFKYIVYDVCDNHFGCTHDAHYRKMIERADVVTCSTPVLAQIIKAHTGKMAVVIEDPYEGEPGVPEIVGDTLLWFGHASGLRPLHRLIPMLPGRKVEVCTNSNRMLPDEAISIWSPEMQAAALYGCAAVLLPVDQDRNYKSANRAVTAIRAGRLPLCEHMPAYDELASFIPVGDIPSNLDRVFKNRKGWEKNLMIAQDYVENRFSPVRIGLQWFNLLIQLWES